eukprot:Pgem_evm2s19874
MIPKRGDVQECENCEDIFQHNHQLKDDQVNRGPSKFVVLATDEKEEKVNLTLSAYHDYHWNGDWNNMALNQFYWNYANKAYLFIKKCKFVENQNLAGKTLKIPSFDVEMYVHYPKYMKYTYK